MDVGFLDFVIPPDCLSLYWKQILQDFPQHPLHGREQQWKRAIPIVLWGDEGTKGNNSWMLFSWMVDVSLVRTDSKVYTFHTVSLKGDLKFLGQALNLTRHPGCEEVCFRCPATMGRGDFNMVYTNLEGEWRTRELGENPWLAEPALFNLDGFCLTMVSVDWMHCFNLGTCRDLVGAALKILLKDRQYFDGGNLETRFATLNRELRAFLKSEGLSMHLKHIKKSNLVWRNDSCPELRCSANDAAVTLRFLSQKLARKPSPDPYGGLSACVWVAEQLNATILRANIFLTEAEAHQISLLGSSFLRMYLSLANIAQDQKALLFKLRPKYHFIQHMVLDASGRPSGRSPGWDANFMDEDYVKQTLKILKGLHPATAAHNVLKRQVTYLKFAMQKHRAKLG
ncbi:unnamed protein product [Effrenium voratum]|nr:unnamed protein product [Effrenium voratum]